MSTKISKGARLRLLRTVERLQYPMYTIRMVPFRAGRGKVARFLADLQDRGGFRTFTLPPSLAFEIIGPGVAPADSA